MHEHETLTYSDSVACLLYPELMILWKNMVQLSAQCARSDNSNYRQHDCNLLVSVSSGSPVIWIPLSLVREGQQYHVKIENHNC